MHYCSECGQRVVLRPVGAERRPHYVCDACGTVHYRNPSVLVGCLAEWHGRILLCRRAIEPRLSTWTLPAGFMEHAESMEEATRREVYEETGAKVIISSLYSVFDVVHMNEVYIIYRGRLIDGEICAGGESSEVRLFAADELPWGEMFYPAIESLLQRYLDDRSSNEFGVHVGSSDCYGRVTSFEGQSTLYDVEVPVLRFNTAVRR